MGFIPSEKLVPGLWRGYLIGGYSLRRLTWGIDRTKLLSLKRRYHGTQSSVIKQKLLRRSGLESTHLLKKSLITQS